MSHKLQKQLKELGLKLKSLPTSKDALLKLLKVCIIVSFEYSGRFWLGLVVSVRLGF